MPIAVDPVVEQTLETVGQHIEQEAPDELRRREGHHLSGIPLSIIAPIIVELPEGVHRSGPMPGSSRSDVQKGRAV
jgi:hypothetical protein